MENQLNNIDSHRNDYNSKAIIKFSFDPKTIQVAHIQFHINLSASILNFMKNDIQSYGIHRGLFQFDGFWNFQTAHVFSDIIGDNSDTVCMIMHRIEDTLLIHEFNDNNNLMMPTKDDRAWLNNIFKNRNLKSSDLKENCFTHDVKCFKVTQDDTFVSWILHCSNDDLTDYDENNQMQCKNILPSSSWLGVSLPELTEDDKYSTKPTTHRKYSQYLLSTFEGLHLLTGSDSAISNGDNDSQLYLRLRDMNLSKPMNALSRMDYWLDNLVCYVNELMCHHLNDIVKYNKTVLTEDIPYLKDSTFSPNNVKVTAKNLFPFLNSNATNVGYTYWLLKEKNSNVLKLHNLTFIYSDTICKNLFTVPIAMLLYRVIRNAKYNQNNGRPSNSNSNQLLLVNCLQLLDETKYPEITVSVCYLLSDIFIPINTNVRYPDLENLFFVNSLVPECNANEKYSFLYKNGVCSIDIKNLLQSLLEKDEYPKFEKLKSKPDVLTVEHRCKKALYCVGRGLKSLNYKKKPDVQMTNKENEGKVMVLATSVDGKTGHKKNPSRQKKNKVVKNNKDTLHSLQCIGSKTYIWDETIKFFDKACKAFTVLAEQDYLALRYGKALKNFQSAYRCQIFISTIGCNEDQCGYILERISVCCLKILLNWSHVKQYIDEIKAFDDCYDSAIKIFLGTNCEMCNNFTDYTFLPEIISTKKCLLDSAKSCYDWAMKFGIYDHDDKDLFKTLIGTVLVKLTTDYLEEIHVALVPQNTDTIAVQLLDTLTDTKLILKMGVKMIHNFVDVTEIATLYMNKGKWNRYTSQLYIIMSPDNHMNLQCETHIHKATTWYLKCMKAIGNDRSFNPGLWDEALWEMFSATYELAMEKHRVSYAKTDTVCDENEKKIAALLNTCLKYCDLENNTCYLEKYKCQIADIHEILADMFHLKLRSNSPISELTKKQKFRDCISHYTQSCEMFLKINRPIDSLTAINSLISVDELRFRGMRSTQSVINKFVSIGNTLSMCVPALQTLMAPIDDAKYDDPRNDLRDEQISILLQKIQNVLKTTIKGVMGKNNVLMEKLKPVYRESLMKRNEEHEIAHLIRIVNEIIEII